MVMPEVAVVVAPIGAVVVVFVVELAPPVMMVPLVGSDSMIGDDEGAVPFDGGSAIIIMGAVAVVFVVVELVPPVMMVPLVMIGAAITGDDEGTVPVVGIGSSIMGDVVGVVVFVRRTLNNVLGVGFLTTLPNAACGGEKHGRAFHKMISISGLSS
jgi:hypothetical protein